MNVEWKDDQFVRVDTGQLSPEDQALVRSMKLRQRANHQRSFFSMFGRVVIVFGAFLIVAGVAHLIEVWTR